MKITKLFMLTLLGMLLFNGAYAQLKWIPFEGELPANAVIGGVEDHRSLAVCRCEYQGAMHPGKVVEKACNIGYGGVEKVVRKFEVLVNNGGIDLDWIKSDGTPPSEAVVAGKEKGQALYVGRAHHKNGTHPGKIFRVGKTYICNIGFGGKELVNRSFEYLVEHKHSENNIFHDRRCDEKSTKAIISNSVKALQKERQINEGSSLLSQNLKYQTRVTDDGRLVVEEILDYAICDNGRILIFNTNEIWANTAKPRSAKEDYYLKFQNDGNLCIYSEQSGFVWCSMSNGKDGHHFEITNIGHIEVVNSHGVEVWPD